MTYRRAWSIAPLKDIATKITDGTHKTPKYQKSGIRFISIKNIRPFKPVNFDAYEKYISRSEHEELTKRCNPEFGDILFPRIGTLGFAKRIDFKDEVSLFVGLGLIKPNLSVINERFLEYFMNTRYIANLSAEKANGSGRMTLPLEQTRKFPVPVPPLNEQRRIVEKIETLFARLDKGEEALREVQKLLARYRQSVLKAAVTGQLTADWRAANANRLEHGCDLLALMLQTRREAWDGRGKYQEPAPPDTAGLPALPEGWVWATLGQITSIKGGVTVDKKRESTDPVTLPYLRVANVQNGFLDLDEVKEITVDRKKAEQCLLQPGDILLNEGGDRDKLGRGWVWNGEIAPCIHQNHVFRARPVLKGVSSRFISYYANAFGQPFFMQKGKQSVNLASISLTAIAGLPIPLPSIKEQDEIVIAIEEELGRIEKVSQACETELARSAALRQSILKDAFAGRLVPQEAADEPAAALLARIKEARAAAPPMRRRRASA